MRTVFCLIAIACPVVAMLLLAYGFRGLADPLHRSLASVVCLFVSAAIGWLAFKRFIEIDCL